ncbi:MAG: hypothetical protein LBK98_02360 [Peptococcaceae bacterium]|jgi:hypothetical protein|nr:hypothetical protein [Peptococcaceae bacterium]
MIPWADIIVILWVTLWAYLGYSKGLLGALRRIIGNIVGLIGAWLLTPLALAWLEGFWGLETALAKSLLARLPASLLTLIHGVGETARTLQELKENLLALPLPPEVILYLTKASEEMPSAANLSMDALLERLALDLANNILWAISFIVLWRLVALFTRHFLGLFTGQTGWGLFGALDRLLGLVAMTGLSVVFLIVICGVLQPIILVSEPGSGLGRLYPYAASSQLLRWLAGVYQFYLLPLIR